MIFQEPIVEYVQLIPTDISTISGSSYRVCQYTGYSTVTCEEMESNISKTQLCGTESPCPQMSSNAESFDEWNQRESCDEFVSPDE